MAYWLGRAAHELRSDTDVLMVDIASAARMSEGSVSRFEQGKNKGFPNEADKIVEAYARELDLDAAAVWDFAMDMWQRNRKGIKTEPDDVRRLVAEIVLQSRQRRGSNPEDSSDHEARGR